MIRIEELYEKARNLPRNPGVYLWLDSSGKVIYVGKAKDLRARVTSYFRAEGDGRPQLPFLMSHAAGLDYIITGTEIEALVTEANMVRSQKPRYNVRLKDDKRYPFIKFTKEPVPRVLMTRSLVEDGSRYLGPYTDSKAVRKTIELVHSIFPLRFCSENITPGKKTRSCLNFQIKKCSGPCVGYINIDEYNNYVEDAYRFVIGRNNELIRDLETRMTTASDALEFEKAALFRDQLSSIQKIIERRKAFSTNQMEGDWDAVNYHIIDNEASVVIMEIRDGVLLGKKNYFLGGVQYSQTPEMIAEFLAQHYLRTSWMPPEIHLTETPEDSVTLENLFSEIREAKFCFVYPQRGEKLRILKLAALNAENSLRETLEKRDRRKDEVPGAALAFQKDLNLKQTPRTIACIDISHLGGTDTVGSLVFFRDGKPEKSEYRHFKIGTVQGIDDFASMREVVERYFSRRIEDKKELPDLLLVDGGKGQLSSAKLVLDNLKLSDQAVAGLAKRLEEIFLPGFSDPQNIPKTSSTIHLLQRIRDEAHRFAVTYQRKLRTKRTVRSALQNIEGIGPEKTKTLIKHFGSVEKIKNAEIEEIAEVKGIGTKLAEIVKTALAEK
jgi:excinuclease ABC subunit C